MKTNKEIRKTSYQLEVLSRIIEMRKKNDSTQMMVAEILGVTNGQIGNAESRFRSHKYTLSHIYKLCKTFNIPIQYIFLGIYSQPDTNQLIDAIVKYEGQ